MDTALNLRLRRIGYRRARALLLGIGLAALAVIAAITFIRRVETVEVVATLLFVPVFLALVFWRIPGGVIAGLLASGVYALMRLPAIDAVGSGPFFGLILSRAAAFVAFGLIGGWAAKQLENTIRKQDLYDQIDDATGLFNARFFLQQTDLELSRLKRYQTLFSVAWLDIPAPALDELGRRKATRALRDLGRNIRGSIRTVDRAVHGRMDGAHRLAVILPETGREGAHVFTGRFAEAVGRQVSELGGRLPREQLTARSATLPDDEEALRALQEDFDRIDRIDHPETHEVTRSAP